MISTKSKRRIGWCMIASGVSTMSLLAAFFFYGNWEQRRLLSEQKPTAAAASLRTAPESHPATQKDRTIGEPAPTAQQDQPHAGAPIGKLEIPKIGLQAAYLEGTSLSVLAIAPGHLNTSVLPGENGSSILAAHNVTTFHRIGELQFEDSITVTTDSRVLQFRVYSTEIVKVGDDVFDTPYPSLILETCYPFDAVQLTDQRYLVHAALVSDSFKPSSSAQP